MVIESNDVDLWEETLLEVHADDIYYQRDYLAMLEANGEGRARLASYRSDDGSVVYPFLIRDVLINGMRTGYKDTTSPYGYSGPLAFPISADRLTLLLGRFRNALQRYLLAEKVVSEFIRFHPLLNNVYPISALMNTAYARTTVYVDTLRALDEIWMRSLNSKTRNIVRKAERLGVSVLRRSSEAMSTFRSLYELTMERVCSNPYYRFSDDYFARLAELIDRRGLILEARLSGHPVASLLLLAGGSFAHYHLSGSDPSYRQVPATDLLLWEAIKWTNENGLRALHLGGGHSGAQDSLFRFKAGFSRDWAAFHIGKAIINSEVYRELVRQTGTESADFFPQYRCGLG